MSVDPTVTIGNVGSTICDMDVEVGWEVDPDGADGTLTLTATASGCTPVVTNPVRTVPAMQVSGSESFALSVSGCANGTKVTIKATIQQGAGTDSVTRTPTVDCA
jgi:hypothetical protein